MPRYMKDQVLKYDIALVTGSRRGIGKSIALALAGAGADVALCDSVIEDGLLESTEKEIKALGRNTLAFQADISRKNEIEKVVRSTIDNLGQIDILVNCAGIWIPGQNLVETSEENWDKVIDTNLKGTYLCCQAVGKFMIEQQSGNIINLSSQVGLTPGAGTGAYSVSKAGIIMLTRQLARELAKYHIRVNALAPGVVKTEFNASFWKGPDKEKQASAMVPLGRLAEAQDISEAALFLASEASSYITGQVIAINGGWAPN